ncbi:MAG: DNA alkylation repair protein [Saprospiraceae bacterium]|nr:DNA alkylation repair protein [Saprospiraceae bacterium]
MAPEQFVDELKQVFQTHANSDDAIGMSKYMKDKFLFYGIRSPQRKELSRTFLKLHPPSAQQLPQLVTLLWNQPERELQYVGITLLEKYIKKQESEFVNTIEWLIVHKSWWDTVDFLGPLAGALFLKYPQLQSATTDAWIQSDNMWLNRAAILFQLKYGGETDFELLSKYVLQHASHADFFIRKAIGWALRQYSKFNPDAVQSFIERHEKHLSTLSKREGMKVILRQ